MIDLALLITRSIIGWVMATPHGFLVDQPDRSTKNSVQVLAVLDHTRFLFNMS